jgi:hypothetical protein
MFKKLIINGNNFRREVISFFSKSSEIIDVEDINSAGKFMMFNRGWFWVSQFNFDDSEWLGDLIKLCDEDFFVALKLSIHYFEEHEEYEKCAFLKKIQIIVETGCRIITFIINII